MRVKEAYFVYSNAIGEQPISVSVGRRPATNGFLANYRENEKASGSPLVHITNREVNAAMVKFSWDRFIPGEYMVERIVVRCKMCVLQEVFLRVRMQI